MHLLEFLQYIHFGIYHHFQSPFSDQNSLSFVLIEVTCFLSGVRARYVVFVTLQCLALALYSFILYHFACLLAQPLNFLLHALCISINYEGIKSEYQTNKMATLITKMSAFRDRHPRKLIIAAMMLITLFIALLFNQRMIIGWWYYRSEYNKITEGYDYLAETCYHTLREPNMWKRVQNNADWYWYQRCRGHRDSLGVIKSQWKLHNFVNSLIPL